MNPVANAGISVTVAEAATGLLVWLVGLAGVTIPTDVAGYIAILITAGSSYLIHTTTKEDKPNV